jgi:chromosome partitioning protein
MEGGTFRALRQQLRLTQQDLADQLNQRFGRSYDKPKLSKWENGKDAVPEDVARVIEDMVARQPRNAQVIAFANQKGGVGKTTSALNIARALVETGHRVLLVDADPQATATSALFGLGGVELYRQGRTLAHVLLREQDLRTASVPAGEILQERSAPFDVIPSHIELAEADGHKEAGFEVALGEVLNSVRAFYDFIIIDAPPNLGVLTVMALTAADLVIIPVQTEPFDSMGVGLILQTIKKVQRRLNTRLRLAGILPTRYAASRTVDRQVVEHLVAAMEGAAPILEPVPDSAIFGRAAISGRLALDASPSAKPVQVYIRLAAALGAGEVLPEVTFDKDASTVEAAE